FEQIAALLAAAKSGARLGVCLDTCHVFAAGYDLRTRRGYDETMRRFHGAIGFDRLIAVHVNDSKRELGSRVDGHEPMGKGPRGTNPSPRLITEESLPDGPLAPEPPKDEECREDAVTRTTLRGLVGRRR